MTDLSQGRSGQSTPESQSAGEAASVQLVAHQFSGPVPHPEVLAQYNNALPSGAERIVAMAENQATHRHRMEARGQVFGFVLALVALIGGIVLIALGNSAAGLVPLIAAVATLVGLFVYREVSTRRAEKALQEG